MPARNPGHPEPAREPNAALLELYRKSGAEQFGITAGEFTAILDDVARKGECSGRERQEFFARLHVEDLALARACAAGNLRVQLGRSIGTANCDREFIAAAAERVGGSVVYGKIRRV